MENALSPTAKRELKKSLAHCGGCRIRLEALQAAGLDVSAEADRLDTTQQAAEALLRLEQSTPPKS